MSPTSSNTEVLNQTSRPSEPTNEIDVLLEGDRAKVALLVETCVVSPEGALDVLRSSNWDEIIALNRILSGYTPDRWATVEKKRRGSATVHTPNHSWSTNRSEGKATHANKNPAPVVPWVSADVFELGEDGLPVLSQISLEESPICVDTEALLSIGSFTTTMSGDDEIGSFYNPGSRVRNEEQYPSLITCDGKNDHDAKVSQAGTTVVPDATRAEGTHASKLIWSELKCSAIDSVQQRFATIATDENTVLNGASTSSHLKSPHAPCETNGSHIATLRENPLRHTEQTAGDGVSKPEKHKWRPHALNVNEAVSETMDPYLLRTGGIETNKYSKNQSTMASPNRTSSSPTMEESISLSIDAKETSEPLSLAQIESPPVMTIPESLTNDPPFISRMSTLSPKVEYGERNSLWDWELEAGRTVSPLVSDEDDDTRAVLPSGHYSFKFSPSTETSIPTIPAVHEAVKDCSKRREEKSIASKWIERSCTDETANTTSHETADNPNRRDVSNMDFEGGPSLSCSPPPSVGKAPTGSFSGESQPIYGIQGTTSFSPSPICMESMTMPCGGPIAFGSHGIPVHSDVEIGHASATQLTMLPVPFLPHPDGLPFPTGEAWCGPETTFLSVPAYSWGHAYWVLVPDIMPTTYQPPFDISRKGAAIPTPAHSASLGEGYLYGPAQRNLIDGNGEKYQEAFLG